MVEPRDEQEQRVRAQHERREELAANLRRAFPIDGGGSFVGLLRTLGGPTR